CWRSTISNTRIRWVSLAKTPRCVPDESSGDRRSCTEAAILYPRDSNRLHYCNERKAMELLRIALLHRVSIEGLESFDMSAGNWTEWADGMNRFISEQARKRDE